MTPSRFSEPAQSWLGLPAAPESIAQAYDITLDLSAGEQTSGHRRLYYVASDSQKLEMSQY